MFLKVWLNFKIKIKGCSNLNKNKKLEQLLKKIFKMDLIIKVKHKITKHKVMVSLYFKMVQFIKANGHKIKHLVKEN